MAVGRWQGAWLLVLALLLAGWWWLGLTPAGEGEPARTAPVAAEMTPSVPESAAPAPVGPRGTLPGVVLPPIESATPSEVVALRDAEIERSAAAAPVASYRGADGRRHAFAYQQTPAEDAILRDEDARREQVVARMRANPVTFATSNKLRAREVERMLDGSLEVPGRLLH